MRLPWPFGRRSLSEGPSSAATEAGAAGARPVDAGRPASAGPSPSTPTRAWAALPPIQRTAGAAPLVAPSAPFLDDVPGHRPLPPILQPLGHDAGPSGPPGLVVAHPHPVPSLTSQAPMPARPVQRRTAARDALPAEAATAWSEPASATGTGWTPSPSEAADPVPVRHVAAVSPAAIASPPARPLTRTTTLVPAGRPVVARSATSATPSAAADAPSSAWGTAADARWSEAPSTNATSGGAASADPGLPLGPRRGASERSGASERATAGEAPVPARRPGLGAPIAAAPTSGVAQRLPMRTPVRPHTSAAAASDARAAARTASARDGGPDPAGASSRTARLPVLPVASRHADGGSAPAQASTAQASAPSLSRRASSSPVSAGATGAPGAGRPGAATTGTTTRPTLGYRPLRPSIATQRDAERGSTGSALAPSASGEASTAPVAAHWGAGEALPDTVVSRSLGSATTSLPSVQLTALGAGVTRPAALPSEIVFPPRDAGTDDGVDARPSWRAASPDATAPAPWSSVGQPTITSPAHGSTAAPGSASRAGAPVPARPLMLARSVAASAAVAPSQAGGSGAPVVARIVADPSIPGGAPTVQTSAGGGTGVTPVGAITATPIVQRVDGAAPPVESDPQGHSDTELDDLARALFGRIRTHLRAEVIHEREAKGLTFDAF